MKKPVPIATRANPRKNVGVVGTAMEKCPAAMTTAPTVIERWVPQNLSAM